MEELQAGDPPQVGPYLLLGRLGVGGMGQVFLGRSPGGRLVAVKVIRAELAADPGFRARFAGEVAAARLVSGVFTAAVVDADPAAPLPWLVTGLVNGPSLAEAVEGHGPLPVASVLALAAGLAEGLGAVHAAGVVHRDLKPSNVLLAADGPRVIDFGISRAVDATHLTRTGMVIGSPAFMSPEQVEAADVGPASDVFSLGAVLVFAATGAGPFGAGAPTVQMYRVVHGVPRLDQVPGPVRPLAERCLAKDPGQRPTARQFLAELTAAHPSAADLTDWLPTSILSAAAPPHRARPGQVPSPSAAAPDPAAGPAPANPPAVAQSGPPPQDVTWLPTVTSTADHGRPGSASTTERQTADMVQPLPTAEVGAELEARSASAAAVSPAAGLDVAEAAPGSGSGPGGPGGGEPAANGAGGSATVGGAGDDNVQLTQPSPTGRRKGRRRALIIATVASVVVAVGGGAVLAVHLRLHPPVLRPAGLAVQGKTTSSLTIDWSGPATGPLPDKYEILRDGTVIGTVPGTATHYTDSGLAPGSPYHYQVIAVRGGEQSPISQPLTGQTALLQPTGLAVQGKTTSSLTIDWSGPATGPLPDKYEILLDGTVIGTVPGTATHYTDSGLAPGFPYQYQVIAVRGGEQSPRSSGLTIRTLTPPVSAAVLIGVWTVSYEHATWYNYTKSPLPLSADSWTLTPKCAVGPCSVTLDGIFQGNPFTTTLYRQGAVYTGTATNTYPSCGSAPIENHMTFRIKVLGAVAVGVTWTATSWAGTMVLYTSTSGGCSSAGIGASIRGTQ